MENLNEEQEALVVMEFHEEKCWDSDIPLEQNPKLKPHAMTVFLTGYFVPKLYSEFRGMICRPVNQSISYSTSKNLKSYSERIQYERFRAAHFKCGAVNEHFEERL
ncbi:hypothetical protein Gotur_002771 [Gossypium turneri]